MPLRRLVLSLALLALAGCATPYGAASGARDYGYSETRLEDGSWRVEVSANASTDRETVERHLLRRAAELTLESGAERFLVLEREVTPVVFYAPVVAAAPRPSFLFDHRDHRRRHRDDPFGWRREERLARMGLGRSGRAARAGLWVGPPVHVFERPVTRWRASAQVEPLPTGAEVPGAKDARAVLAALDAGT